MKKKKLKIATVVASELPFPIPSDFPRPYAPLQVALDVAEGLAERGHRITFFGPAGSKSKKFEVITAPFVPLYKNKILEMPEVYGREREKIFGLFDQYLVALLFKENLKRKFDIIHIHPADRALPLAFLTDTPVVYTLHDPLYKWRGEIFKLYQTKNQYFISLSDAQRKSAPDLNYAGTCYNGIDLNLFPYSEKPKNQCLFLGRILPRKGVAEAIKVAIKAGENLVIAGNSGSRKGKYWKTKIKPYLKRKNIKYVGSVPYPNTHKYYGRAKVLLCPIKWEEPFGLTFIESMACGTPVIAFDRGSVREVIKNGKTGFVVKNLSQMAKAIKKIDKISRKDCRKWVEDNFTTERMIEDYEKVFYKILLAQKKIK